MRRPRFGASAVDGLDFPPGRGPLRVIPWIQGLPHPMMGPLERHLAGTPTGMNQRIFHAVESPGGCHSSSCQPTWKPDPITGNRQPVSGFFLEQTVRFCLTAPQPFRHKCRKSLMGPAAQPYLISACKDEISPIYFRRLPCRLLRMVAPYHSVTGTNFAGDDESPALAESRCRDHG